VKLPNHQDGLIYVIDIRNGLYILRYTGKGAGEVTGIRFYEGNSPRRRRPARVLTPVPVGWPG